MKVVITWALVATAVAIGSLGYILGKQAGSAQAHTQWLPSADQPGATDDIAGLRAPQAVYTVPEQFAEQPQQWRSDVSESFEGYAALFAPSQREVIVEHCKHEGYKEDGNGQIAIPGSNFCETVLWVTLASLSDDRAGGMDRSGQSVDVRVSLDASGEAPELRLRFAGHDARMIPGSKNDLLQAMERHPEMAAQKKRFMAAMIGGNREREAQTSAPENTANRP